MIHTDTRRDASKAFIAQSRVFMQSVDNEVAAALGFSYLTWVVSHHTHIAQSDHRPYTHTPEFDEIVKQRLYDSHTEQDRLR